VKAALVLGRANMKMLVRPSYQSENGKALLALHNRVEYFNRRRAVIEPHNS